MALLSIFDSCGKLGRDYIAFVILIYIRYQSVYPYVYEEHFIFNIIKHFIPVYPHMYGEQSSCYQNV
ncbi:protein of unknown function [Xenorhabdus poinarii G6]|uniref:Uncharacterized protein n=1 Tax=Xenorhabdus poinarii G6 TaxID=1354304 RepID=A0A068QZK6_9GAMM|nr:protein of unknown function [Xenorhabdus poinarii G6]